jgi:hypothetical protein
VDFADGVASLGICCGSDGARVENDHICRRRIGGRSATLLTKLPFDGSAVGLGSPAAELLDKEGAHRKKVPEFYLSIEQYGITATQEDERFTAGRGSYRI